jgi:starvation-inducible DNA-binding protein
MPTTTRSRAPQSDQRNGRTPSPSPILQQRAAEIQPYGTLRNLPIGLDEKARSMACERVNHILADTMTIGDLYQKHHWQVAGPTFYQLHLLFEKHYNEQAELVDALAERIQLLGGISVAMAHDVAELTRIKRPPKGAEEVPVQISRLLEAHEIIIKDTRDAATVIGEAGDTGTEDLLISDVLRTNELQVWFLSEHIVGVDLVDARE